jgi:periplasmic copper chaperone A
MRHLHAAAPAVLCGLLCVTGWCAAQAATVLDVQDAWLRAPRRGFGATVVFMTLKPVADAELVGVSSPVAKAVELHQMVRTGSVVSMEPVSAIKLPAGQATQLHTGEGAFHLMAVKIARPLKGGELLPFQLRLRDAGGAYTTRSVKVRVVAPAHEHAGADDDVH